MPPWWRSSPTVVFKALHSSPQEVAGELNALEPWWWWGGADDNYNHMDTENREENYSYWRLGQMGQNKHLGRCWGPASFCKGGICARGLDRTCQSCNSLQYWNAGWEKGERTILQIEMVLILFLSQGSRDKGWWEREGSRLWGPWLHVHPTLHLGNQCRAKVSVAACKELPKALRWLEHSPKLLLFGRQEDHEQKAMRTPRRSFKAEGILYSW